MLNELRDYIRQLEEIQVNLDNLPILNYDSEIENFYEESSDKLEKHLEVMKKRLQDLEQKNAKKFERK